MRVNSPLTSGWDTFHRIHRADFVPSLNKLFEDGQFPIPLIDTILVRKRLSC